MRCPGSSGSEKEMFTDTSSPGIDRAWATAIASVLPCFVLRLVDGGRGVGLHDEDARLGIQGEPHAARAGGVRRAPQLDHVGAVDRLGADEERAMLAEGVSLEAAGAGLHDHGIAAHADALQRDAAPVAQLAEDRPVAGVLPLAGDLRARVILPHGGRIGRQDHARGLAELDEGLLGGDVLQRQGDARAAGGVEFLGRPRRLGGARGGEEDQEESDEEASCRGASTGEGTARLDGGPPDVHRGFLRTKRSLAGSIRR